MYGQGLEMFYDVRICNYNTVGVAFDFFHQINNRWSNKLIKFCVLCLGVAQFEFRPVCFFRAWVVSVGVPA